MDYVILSKFPNKIVATKELFRNKYLNPTDKHLEMIEELSNN